MIRGRPGSPLFPYTTLFRSGVRFDVSGSADNAPSTTTFEPTLDQTMPARPVLYVEASGIDRKSTRLNSSHVEISYAVFCLKKKNRHLPLQFCNATRRHKQLP